MYIVTSVFIQNKRIRFPSRRQFPEDVDVTVVSDSLAHGFRTVTKQSVIDIGEQQIKAATLGQLGSRDRKERPTLFWVPL